MDKNTILLNRPLESDTKIISQALVTFEECSGLFEKWNWDGITAKSLIFLKSDVDNYDKKELIPRLFKQMAMELDPKYTYIENGDYVFINFGFEVD